MEQARATGKPEAVLEKMVEGRMSKFYSETCLLEQPFVKDPKETVQDHISALYPEDRREHPGAPFRALPHRRLARLPAAVIPETGHGAGEAAGAAIPAGFCSSSAVKR